MSGFADQRAKIRQALVSAGIDADAATRLANALCNSEQSLYHAGESTQDSTPKDLRLVTPNQRKWQFPSLDFRAGDPDHRQRRTETSEERKKKEQQPNVTVVEAPQCNTTNVQFRVTPGNLTDVQNNGQSVAVDVRSVVAGLPQGGLPVVTLDPRANQLVGKAPVAKVPADGSVKLDIEQGNADLTWNLQLPNRDTYDVVTKVEFVDGEGLRVHYDKITAWSEKQPHVEKIPTTNESVITDIIEDRHGLRGSRKAIPVFASYGRAPSFFNVFRVGTFVGEWKLGDTKTVVQVWPASDKTVTVVNLIQHIPDDGTLEAKNVLFAVRTKDHVDAAGAYNDDPRPSMAGVRFNGRREPVLTEGDPEPTYYAIAIQGMVDDGGGEGGGPTPLTVLTHVTRTNYGLEFERKKIYVWSEPEAPLVIEECCPGACCYEGDCSIKTQAECKAIGGVWQGANTTCDGDTCDHNCCFPEGECGGASYHKCGGGYFTSTCESLGGTVIESCDGFVSHPGTGHPLCLNGPTQLTVTVTGAVAVNPADNALADACNGTFVFDFPGTAGGLCTLYTNPHVEFVNGKTIYVQVMMSPFFAFGVAATLSVYPFVWNPSSTGFPDSSVTHNTGVPLPVAGQYCTGADVYDCSGYTLPAGRTTGTVGTIDFSNATISIS